MKRQTPTNAVAAISIAVRKLDTGPELVQVPSQQNSGRFGGNTTAHRVANMNGAELKRVAT